MELRRDCPSRSCIHHPCRPLHHCHLRLSPLIIPVRFCPSPHPSRIQRSRLSIPHLPDRLDVINGHLLDLRLQRSDDGALDSLLERRLYLVDLEGIGKLVEACIVFAVGETVSSDVLPHEACFVGAKGDFMAGDFAVLEPEAFEALSPR